jgi:hypothetical protein
MIEANTDLSKRTIEFFRLLLHPQSQSFQSAAKSKAIPLSLPPFAIGRFKDDQADPKRESRTPSTEGHHNLPGKVDIRSHPSWTSLHFLIFDRNLVLSCLPL